MLTEEAIVLKAYAEINRCLTEIRRYQETKNDDEIIASYMECLGHREAEWLFDVLSQIGAMIWVLDMIKVSPAARDPNLEALVKRYMEILP